MGISDRPQYRDPATHSLKNGISVGSTKDAWLKMRAHHATGHRWDVTKGQWIDE
jgi:hypothetical protein